MPAADDGPSAELEAASVRLRDADIAYASLFKYYNQVTAENARLRRTLADTPGNRQLIVEAWNADADADEEVVTEDKNAANVLAILRACAGADKEAP